MASRKDQKAELRARREELEREQAKQERRRRRLYQLGALAVAAIVAVAVAVVASGGGGSKGGIQTGTQATRTRTQVDSLLAGIAQSGSTLGNPKAPVEMAYFSDLECPVCRDFSLNTLPEVIAKQVRTGKLRLTYRSLESATKNRETYATQQVAALAAGKQNLLWQFVDLFYHQQGEEGTAYVTAAYLSHLAGQIAGLDIARWNKDRSDATLGSQLNADAAAAQQVGADSTPTLVFTGPGGVKGVAGDLPYSDVVAEIKAVAG